MRLTHPSIRPVGRSFTIRFDGKEITALAGESVAAALSAAGILAFRHTPSGAPRGIHCGIGACFDCLVTIDSKNFERACMTPARPGMEVTSAPAERALLPSPPVRTAPMERSPDVLVVGGGPAGLAAATAVAESGAAVVLLDERAKPGGQYFKPLAASHEHAAPDRQFRAGERLREAARAAGATIETEAFVWGAFAPDEIDEIAALVRGASVLFHPRRLILAPGATERPVALPGWTLPGVMTTGALQTLARAQRVCPAEPVVVAGNGPLNFQLAAGLVDSGVRVAAVVEAARPPRIGAVSALLSLAASGPDLLASGLSDLSHLRRKGIPVLWASHAIAIEGRDRVTAVRVRTPAGEERIEAALVALNSGFQPETVLARALGARHRLDDRGLGALVTVTDEVGRTSLPSTFAVGDGATFGGARIALARGRLAGLAAARDLGFRVASDHAARGALRRAEQFQRALWRVFAPAAFDHSLLTPKTIVCRCEEVTLTRIMNEIAAGATSLTALKKATRAGMGPCQGRFCAATIAYLSQEPPDPLAFAAPRPPARPIPIAPFLFDGPEFTAEHIANPTLPHLPARRVAREALRSADVLVIGGGIVGLATAYYLAREGVDVIVAERDRDFTMAASTANAGSLHVQLLAYDFSESGPADGGPAAATLPLGPESIALWKEIAREAGDSLGIVTDGGLMLAASEPALRWLAAKVALENRNGLQSRLIGASELRSLAPGLSSELLGADFCPGEGYGDPLRASAAIRRLAAQRGARLAPATEVTSLARDGATWRARTTSGPIRAGQVVNATGPYGRAVAAMAGLSVPVAGTVQQVMVTMPAPRMMRHLILLAERHLSLKQHADGRVLIGGGWFGSYDGAMGWTAPLRRNIEINLAVASRAVPALRRLDVVRIWTGMAPEVDAAPILGEAPGHPGFFNALAANAYTLGPVMGRLTTDAICRGRPIPRAWTLERLATQPPHRETVL